MSFNEDAYDRLQLWLADVPFRHQLDPAARLVGHQLELLKPSLISMVKVKDALYAGPVASVTSRTVLIVFADHRRVLTLHAMPTDSVAVMATDLVTYVETGYPDSAGAPAEMDALMRRLLKKYGGQPGEKTPNMGMELAARALGMLLSLVAPVHRQKADDRGRRMHKREHLSRAGRPARPRQQRESGTLLLRMADPAPPGTLCRYGLRGSRPIPPWPPCNNPPWSLRTNPTLTLGCRGMGRRTVSH